MPSPRSNFTKSTARLFTSRVTVTRVRSHLGEGTVEIPYTDLPCLIQPLTGRALSTALGISSEARYWLFCAAEFKTAKVVLNAGDVLADQHGKNYSVPTPSNDAGNGHHVECYLGDKL